MSRSFIIYNILFLFQICATGICYPTVVADLGKTIYKIVDLDLLTRLKYSYNRS